MYESNAVHVQAIKEKIPGWVLGAPPATHAALRGKGLESLPWLEEARREHPEVLTALAQSYSAHRQHEAVVDQRLAPLKPIDQFAAPLLAAAIKDEFGLEVDVTRTYLFHARHFQVDQTFASASKDPLVQVNKALRAATRTLLQAALQNFEAWETRDGGLDLDSGRKASLYSAYPIKSVFVDGPTLPIRPERFAALCRKLDLGGQYQACIGAAFNASDRAVEASFLGYEKTALEIQAHIAYLKKDLGKPLYEVLLEVARGRRAIQLDGKPLEYSCLRLWDVELTGIVVLGRNRLNTDALEQVVVYMPGDPFFPLKEYPSAAAFTASLRERMFRPGYLEFFRRFVPARHQSQLFKKIQERIRPLVWNKERGWYEHMFDKNARLAAATRQLPDALWPEFNRQKLQTLTNNGLFHAVPTAAEDRKSVEERLEYFLQLGLDALNVAAFIVPGVGEVMLAVTAVQLAYETYEGIESWARGEQEQAWGYLMDVVENLALITALGAASAGAGKVPVVEVPEFVSELHPVEWPEGATRLWKPDLAPFAHDTVLPAGLKPNELGLYEHQGKTWLPLDGRNHELVLDPVSRRYRALHPRNPKAYQPTLQHNGAGAWTHQGENPLQWERLKLFRRLGPAASEGQFSDRVAERIMQVSHTDENMLRHALADGERPPALLEDTMQRFQLDQEIQSCAETLSPAERDTLFETRYQALQGRDHPSTRLIRREFPGLPVRVAGELARAASNAEWQQLHVEQRVPLHLAEEARFYLQELRLARAYEGLYLESVTHPDGDILTLHSLEKMPGWSTDLRIEVRQDRFDGVLLDSVGPPQASIRKVLVKRGSLYEARSSTNEELHGADDLCGAVQHALPDAERAALGYPHVGQGAELRQALLRLDPLPRSELRKLLKMQPIKPGFRSPMRLANGRTGYPLSGRGAAGFTASSLKARVQGLYPGFLEEEIEAFIAERLQTEPLLVLSRLEAEFATLTSDLEAWGEQVPAQHPLTGAALSTEETAAQRLNRRLLIDELKANWRRELTQVNPYRSGRFVFKPNILGELPELSANFSHITEMVLTNQGAYLQGRGFLKSFSELRFLTLYNFALGEFPEEIHQLRELTSLTLNGCGIRLSEATAEGISRMEGLELLDLDDNPLGQPLYLGYLKKLEELHLSHTGLTQVPQGMFDLENLRYADLTFNQITELPDDLFEVPDTRKVNYNLTDNPLSAHSQQRIADYEANVGLDRKILIQFDQEGVDESDEGADSDLDWEADSDESGVFSELDSSNEIDDEDIFRR